MARIDLNIVDRGVQGTEWVAEDVSLTAEHLDEVMEQKTDNSGALNSLPTPFARFFVAREAFRRTMEEHLNPAKKEAGFAYRQMVSDILDVYELIFNIKYHRNNSWNSGQKLELREWKSSENLAYLQNEMPVLFNSLDNYYKTDIMEDKLYFLIFTEAGHDKLLACSSPITGFVTPPDMDKALVRKDGTTKIIFADEDTGNGSDSKYKNLHIRRKSEGEYFREIKMFEDREELISRPCGKWDTYAKGFSHQGTPIILTEFGGIGFDVSSDEEKAWGYTNATTEEEYVSEYKRVLDVVLDSPVLAGFCYTQLTDVMQEKNGIYAFDRRVKFDMPRIKAIISKKAAIEK